MWREGFDLTLLAWVLNVIALAAGAGLGFRALIDPAWAQRLLRLRADETRPDGFAAFRAHGGLFFAAHAAALAMSVNWINAGAVAIGLYASGAAVVLSAAWAGAAGGRVLAMLRDGARTRFNLVAACVELGMALAIGAPWVVWVFARPG